MEIIARRFHSGLANGNEAARTRRKAAVLAAFFRPSYFGE
jgi:hypothetical protein